MSVKVRGMIEMAHLVTIKSPPEGVTKPEVEKALLNIGSLETNVVDEKFAVGVPLFGNKPNGDLNAILTVKDETKLPDYVSIRKHRIRLKWPQRKPIRRTRKPSAAAENDIEPSRTIEETKNYRGMREVKEQSPLISELELDSQTIPFPKRSGEDENESDGNDGRKRVLASSPSDDNSLTKQLRKYRRSIPSDGDKPSESASESGSSETHQQPSSSKFSTVRNV